MQSPPTYQIIMLLKKKFYYMSPAALVHISYTSSSPVP